MNKILLGVIAVALLPAYAFAADGQVLINQATVMAAGGFPYRITQPGSYKLSGNLAVPPGLDGVDITADSVTLDLNGFSIIGPGVFPSAIGVNGTNRQRILLTNGVISGFTICVEFVGSSRMIVLEKLRLDGTTQDSNNTTISGISAIVGQNRAAYAFVRDVTTTGQMQLTCPSYVINTIASIAELNVPPDGGGVDFPTNCKGENVIPAPFN